jgi:hypothetical protein
MMVHGPHPGMLEGIVMSRTPDTRLQKLQYFEDHISPWNTNAVAIGTTTATVATLNTKAQAARTAYNAQQTARQAAEAATENFRVAIEAMNAVGQGILKQIDTMAQTTGNQGVYALAQVAPRATPTSRGAPGKPFDFTVEIGSLGELILKWKNSNGTGAVYTVYRRLGATGEFELLGGIGAKSYTDATVPAGTAVVTYQIQAVRSTGVSQWASFTVNLGIEPGMASVTESTPTKLAA